MQQLASWPLPAQAAIKLIRTSLSLVNFPMSYRAGKKSSSNERRMLIRWNLNYYLGNSFLVGTHQRINIRRSMRIKATVANTSGSDSFCRPVFNYSRILSHMIVFIFNPSVNGIRYNRNIVLKSEENRRCRLPWKHFCRSY